MNIVDIESQLMLKSIIGNRIAFNKFYRKGFYSYNKLNKSINLNKKNSKQR